MTFTNDSYFHIFSQGNNRRRVFFRPANYRFFLWRMRGYLLPFGDLVAYALMPNHFHWLFYVREAEVLRSAFYAHCDAVEYARRRTRYGPDAMAVKPRSVRQLQGMMSLNLAIGTFLGSYAQAINVQQNWSGSLFRGNCKAKSEIATTRRLYLTKDSYKEIPVGRAAYVPTCFRYIHANPTKAGLVTCDAAYPYSSAADYAGLRNGTLCNLTRGRSLLAGPPLAARPARRSARSQRSGRFKTPLATPLATPARKTPLAKPARNPARKTPLERIPLPSPIHIQ